MMMKTILASCIIAFITLSWMEVTVLCFNAGTRAGFLMQQRHHLTAAVSTSELNTGSEERKRSTLKVPSAAWKWPPLWPYPKDYLDKMDGYQPSEISIRSPDDSNFIRHTKDYVQDSQNILIVGMGDGLNTITNIGAFWNSTYYTIGDVSTDFQLPYKSSSFDSIIFKSGIEVLSDPTVLFKEFWRVMKPSGICFTWFSSEPNLPDKSAVPIKMWATMTLEQKIWIAGSYFHYSAVDGWENIEAYDVIGNSGDKTVVFDALGASGGDFIVQARKIESLAMNDDDLTASFKKLLLSVKYLQPEDVKFLSYRLAAAYNESSNAADREDIVNRIDRLSDIYGVLKDMNDKVIPSPIKAMLATFLLKKWHSIPEQTTALRMALSLSPPDEIFWKPVSMGIAQLPPKEKIYFMADMVPAFGLPQYKEVLQCFPTLLIEVLDILKLRFPETSVAKLQSFAVDLLISELVSLPEDVDSSTSLDTRVDRIIRFVKASRQITRKTTSLTIN